VLEARAGSSCWKLVLEARAAVCSAVEQWRLGLGPLWSNGDPCRLGVWVVLRSRLRGARTLWQGREHSRPPSPRPENTIPHFDHERLHAYKLAVSIARRIAKARFPRGDAGLKDQAVRASRSSALNIAEGAARGGKAKANHYRIALGSAAETCSVLDITAIDNGDEIQNDLRRLGAMLHSLSRS